MKQTSMDATPWAEGLPLPLMQEEKMKGLMAILRKYSADFMENGIKYASASVDKVYILRLPIETVTGKGRRK